MQTFSSKARLTYNEEWPCHMHFSRKKPKNVQTPFQNSFGVVQKLYLLRLIRVKFFGKRIRPTRPSQLQRN